MRGRALLMVFLLSLMYVVCGARLGSERQKLEIEKHLNRLNKKPVKSIEVGFILSF